MKAFLSHSSKDKVLVQKVAEGLSKQHCTYDTFSFEEGAKTGNEIAKNIQNNALFVFFISQNSLQSEWVKKELEIFYESLQNDSRKRILPIIIDDATTYNDPLIPDWLKQEYNIKPIKRYRKIIDRIETERIRIIWDFYPKRNKLDNLFIGRHSLIQKLEERHYRYQNSPSIIIASGIDGIGRRTLLREYCQKLDIVDKTKRLSTISLDVYESLEDFILKLYDLGFYVNEIKREDMIEFSDIQKKELLCRIIDVIHKEDEIIIVEDNGCLTLPNGDINKWFLDVLEHIDNYPTLLFVLSRYKTNKSITIGNEKIFAIDVPEFTTEETKRFLKQLIKIEDLSIENSDVEDIAKLLSGHPKQVLYVVEFLKEEGGIQQLLDKSYYIRDWNISLIENVLKQYSKDEKAKNFLVLLSKFDFIDVVTLSNLIGDDEICTKLLKQFISEFICYEVGSNREHIKMNRMVSDAIGRYGWDIGKELNEKLNKHINDFQQQNLEMPTLASYVFSTQEALLNGLKQIDKNERILPSIALKTIITLYDKKKDFSLLIVLANIVLDQNKTLDPVIEEQMRGYLCAAYLRKKQYDKFREEVYKIAGVNHEFLMGLYYRILQRYQEALDRFNKALSLNKGYAKAKREIVRVYIAMRDFQTALELAKKQYQTSKSNHYAFQAYLSCLLKTCDINNMEERKKIEKIFSEFEVFANTSNKAKEMYNIEKAKYRAALGESEALDDIDKIQQECSDSPYPLMAKFEIALKFNNIEDMEYSYTRLEEFENLPNSKILSFYKACILKKRGQEELLKQEFNELERNYPLEQFKRMKEEIQAIDT